MAKDVTLLGEVAERGATILKICRGGCDRRGRLSVARLLAEYGPGTAVGHIMRAQIGECPHKDSAQIQNRSVGILAGLGVLGLHTLAANMAEECKCQLVVGGCILKEQRRQ
jgi:hypothetical protein